ncbi:hypothetical protein EYF80_030436 [Liparis tanakae]|uniref:Uncharacterized protein n=1 Tax=Liparis tanakae TaxID=230148 RepID=A0A4Z2H2M2_9TELE|nr:hypothetical protein EYF80_030436 [Liparis tanakae]
MVEVSKLYIRSLLEGESFPSLCSDVEQESMKVWATTDRQASVMLFLWMSNTNWGFLMTFTQNRRGRLEGRYRRGHFVQENI